MNPYQARLDALISNPDSFKGSPGFKFALDQGEEAIKRRMSATGMRDSGNALAELMKFGTGLAMQDYGSEVDRLGRLTGQEMNFALGAKNSADQYQLGMDQNQITRDRNAQDFSLGEGQLDATRARDFNNWNLQSDRNDMDWLNATTSRGNAMMRYAGGGR